MSNPTTFFFGICVNKFILPPNKECVYCQVFYPYQMGPFCQLEPLSKSLNTKKVERDGKESRC